MNPASSLENKILNNKWKVVEKMGTQRGCFSSGYKVVNVNNRQIGFMKVLNYEYSMQQAGIGQMSTDFIQKAVEEFNYERDLYSFCRENGIKGVIHSIDHGEHIEVGMWPIPYIVLEYAEGGALERTDNMQSFNLEWRLRVFHATAKALRQLHKKGILHKDIHSGNLLFDKQNLPETLRIGDLGQAMKFGDNIQKFGKTMLIPYEFWYPGNNDSWDSHVSCDCFGLGSFLYNLMLDSYIWKDVFTELDSAYRPRAKPFNGGWSGNYIDVLPYIDAAHALVMARVREAIEAFGIEETFNRRIISLIDKLCHPNPSERAHERNTRRDLAITDFSLERVLSDADWLAKRTGLRHVAHQS